MRLNKVCTQKVNSESLQQSCVDARVLCHRHTAGTCGGLYVWSHLHFNRRSYRRTIYLITCCNDYTTRQEKLNSVKHCRYNGRFDEDNFISLDVSVKDAVTHGMYRPSDRNTLCITWDNHCVCALIMLLCTNGCT